MDSLTFDPIVQQKAAALVFTLLLLSKQERLTLSNGNILTRIVVMASQQKAENSQNKTNSANGPELEGKN